MSSEVGVVYSCLVCGRAFVKRASLAAHMRVHRDVEMVKAGFRVPKELWGVFVEACRRHHTTTCHVLYSLIKAFVEGEKRGVVDLSTKNPVVIQVVNLFGARPRGHGKYDPLGGVGSEPMALGVMCFYLSGFVGGEVYCQWLGGSWVPVSRCAECPKNRLRKRGEM